MSKKILFVLLMVSAFSACVQKSDYHRMVTKELAKNIRQDSLFLGISLQMPREKFYAHCWEMNKKGICRQGSNNMTVKYLLDDQELKHPASMDFYPDFIDDKISEMPVHFIYDGWAPWNKGLSSDSLEQDLINYLEKVHPGNPFIKVDIPKKGSISVKVDGNRRIILEKKEQYVLATYTDLSTRPEFK